MNKEQMTQEQRAQLIEKLRAEYNDLNGKIARLNAFLCDIDFVKKVPDPIEQGLMSMQFRSMKGYLDNLRGRIMFQEVHQLREENARKQLDEWKKMKGHIIPVNLDEQHHCGQDAACDEQHGVYFKGKDITSCIGTPDADNTYDMTNPDHVKKFNADMERMYPVQDPNESQPADTVPESIKELVGMQIVSVFPSGWKCQGCAYDSDYFRCEKKVELVGGYMLCLAQIPIVTE